MKRCHRCVMPDIVPGVTLNENGICSYCLNYQKETYLGKDEFDKIVRSTIKKNNRYDNR